MKTRILSLLVLIEMMAPLGAQAQNWGTGLYGGSQNCAANSAMGGVGQQQQPQTNQDSEEVLDLESQLTDLKTEKRDLAKTVSELQRKKQQYSDAISARLSDDWATQVLGHLDDNGSCSCDPSGPSDGPGDDSKTDRSGPPPGGRPPGGGHRVSLSVRTCSRVPASETFGGGNSYDRSWSASSMGMAPMDGGGQCAASEITKSKSWQVICHKGGVTRLVCTHPHFAQEGGEKSPSECLDAIANYSKVSRDLAKAKSRLAEIDSQSKDLRQQIKEARADGAETTPSQRDGGGTGAGPGAGQSSGGGMSTTSLISTLAPLGVGILGGLGAEYMGYKSNQANNTNLTKLGYPTQAYTFGSYGYPFLQSGIYGSLAANQQQNMQGGASFGCASGMNGGGPTMGAYGMSNPSYGMGTMGGYGGLSAMGGMGLSSMSMGANPFTNPYGSYGYSGMSAFSSPVGVAGIAGTAGVSSQYNSLMYRMNQVNAGVAGAVGYQGR